MKNICKSMTPQVILLKHIILFDMNIYVSRKENQISKIKNDLLILSNKARFIVETLEDKIDLRKKKDQVIVELLTTMEI